MLTTGLQNFHPQITRVPALRSDIPGGTNDKVALAPLLSADYIHTGAGSPSYAITHLKNSYALDIITGRIEERTPVSFASAATIALSTWAIPVYELYFAGHDPHWLPGLNFLSQFGLPPLAIVPHWNNHEGGAGIDTRFSYMGQKRWTKLLNLLPKDVTVWGIDEQTAIILDLDNHQLQIMGKGNFHIINADKPEVSLPPKATQIF